MRWIFYIVIWQVWENGQHKWVAFASSGDQNGKRPVTYYKDDNIHLSLEHLSLYAHCQKIIIIITGK